MESRKNCLRHLSSERYSIKAAERIGVGLNLLVTLSVSLVWHSEVFFRCIHQDCHHWLYRRFRIERKKERTWSFRRVGLAALADANASKNTAVILKSILIYTLYRWYEIQNTHLTSLLMRERSQEIDLGRIRQIVVEVQFSSLWHESRCIQRSGARRMNPSNLRRKKKLYGLGDVCGWLMIPQKIRRCEGFDERRKDTVLGIYVVGQWYFVRMNSRWIYPISREGRFGPHGKQRVFIHVSASLVWSIIESSHRLQKKQLDMHFLPNLGDGRRWSSWEEEYKRRQ